MECGCWDGVCMKCHGVKKLILGAVVLAWALLWPSWDWRLVLGGVLVVLGVLKLVMPMCNHCAMPDKKKR